MSLGAAEAKIVVPVIGVVPVAVRRPHVLGVVVPGAAANDAIRAGCSTILHSPSLDIKQSAQAGEDSEVLFVQDFTVVDLEDAAFARLRPLARRLETDAERPSAVGPVLDEGAVDGEDAMAAEKAVEGHHGYS